MLLCKKTDMRLKIIMCHFSRFFLQRAIASPLPPAPCLFPQPLINNNTSTNRTHHVDATSFVLYTTIFNCHNIFCITYHHLQLYWNGSKKPESSWGIGRGRLHDIDWCMAFSTQKRMRLSRVFLGWHINNTRGDSQLYRKMIIILLYIHYGPYMFNMVI